MSEPPLGVAVIGAGRVGTSLAVLLQRAGHRIVAVSGGDLTPERAERYLPGVPVEPAIDAAARADLVLLGTPDDAIVDTCVGLAPGLRPGQDVAHVSGAAGLDTLATARDAGARILSIHPLQTIPRVDRGLQRIPGSAMAVTAEVEGGYTLGERLARDVGARPFRLRDDVKPLYHAAAVFASNYLVAVTGLAEELFAAAGLERPADLFLPLSRASLDNVAELGPGAALTGPAVRGDAGTIARNLRALEGRAPQAVAAYVALASAALDLAERSGRLTPEARNAVEEVLRAWR